MPLSRKIIRNENNCQSNGDMRCQDLHNLGLRHSFMLRAAKCGFVDSDTNENTPSVVPSGLLEEANKKAEEIVRQANEKAAAILEQARLQANTEAETIKKNAAEEGYNKGYKEAMAAARQEAEKIKKSARQVLVQAEKARQDKIGKLKDEVLGLSLDIAEKILTRQLNLNPDSVLDIAGEAIQLVSNRNYVVLWVNPDELEICSQQREKLLAALPPRAELHILTDDTVEKGGCIIETDYGKVDATVSSRWENLIAALKGEPE